LCNFLTDAAFIYVEALVICFYVFERFVKDVTRHIVVELVLTTALFKPVGNFGKRVEVSCVFRILRRELGALDDFVVRRHELIDFFITRANAIVDFK